jgi:hypothetical protein
MEGRILDPSQADKAGLCRLLYALSPHQLRSTATLRPITWSEVESGEHSQVEANSTASLLVLWLTRSCPP